MATSGEIDGVMSVGEIVAMAHELLGVTDENTPLTAEQGRRGLRSLNWMLKGWPTDAVSLWLVDIIEMDWPADEAAAPLAPPYFRILSLRMDDDSSRQLTERSQADYDLIPDKDAEGEPLTWTAAETVDGVQLYLWPVPTSLTSLVGRAVRVAEDVTSLSQNIDIPQRWLEAVTYQLASRLTDFYGKTGERATRVIARAEDLMQDKLAEGRPRVTRIRPRMWGWR